MKVNGPKFKYPTELGHMGEIELPTEIVEPSSLVGLANLDIHICEEGTSKKPEGNQAPIHNFYW